MATKNTLNDIIFAESYVKFVASRSRNREARARAAILVATMKMLDVKFPTWREDLIAELDRTGQTRTTEELFPLPVVDDGALFADFMHNVVGEPPYEG